MLNTTKQSLRVSIIAMMRLKKQAPLTEMKKTPYTLGMTFKSIIVVGVIEKTGEDLELYDDEVDAHLAKSALTASLAALIVRV